MQLDFFHDGDPTPVEAAAGRQLERLAAAGLLTDDHEIMVAAIMAVARTVGIASRKGAAVGLAQASKELREWFAMLPTPPAPEDEFTLLMRGLANGEAHR